MAYSEEIVTKPSKELLVPMNDLNWKPREIIITPLDHGYIVRIECISFAVSKGVHDDMDSVDYMLKKIGNYLKNPKKVERYYNETGKY